MIAYFLRKKVLAIILNLLIIGIGILAFQNLSLREYPKITVPEIMVDIPYPNASADVVERELAFTTEEALQDIPGLEEIVSKAKFGNLSVIMKFSFTRKFSDVMADVRERIAAVRGSFPKDVKEPRISEQDHNQNTVMYLYLKGRNADYAELVHFANLNIKNALLTVDGVSSVHVIGPPYEMEIILDHKKLFAYGMSVSDITGILHKHSLSLPAGKRDETIPIQVNLNLETEEDFGQLVIKKTENGFIQLRDIATITLKDSPYFRVRVDGEKAVLIQVQQSATGNPLDISEDIQELLPDLQTIIPSDMELRINYDKSVFIDHSLKTIYKTIIEACILVGIIIYFSLRHFRAVLIPLVTIPVSLIGTLFIIQSFGFTLNTISLLAIVLAVGLVVDDAIVVLENIHRYIEKGLTPFDAALKGGKDIGFAIIAMSLTLASVYLPLAFITGITGKIFIEFAVTLAGAVLISGITALTLSPLMCSVLLHKEKVERKKTRLQNFGQNFFLSYDHALKWILKTPKLTLFLFGLVLSSTILLYIIIPSTIAIEEDRSVIGAYVPYLENTDIDEFDERVKAVENEFLKLDEKKTVMAFVDDYSGNVFSALKPKADRQRTAVEIKDDINRTLKDVPTLTAYPWVWNSGLPGINVSRNATSEARMTIQTINSYEALDDFMQDLMKICLDNKHFETCSYDLNMGSPRIEATVNPFRMSLLGFDPVKLSSTLIGHFGDYTGVTFRKDGFSYDLRIKTSDTPLSPDEIFVRQDNEAFSLGSFVEFTPSTFAQELQHINGLRGSILTASLAKNVSLEEATQVLRKIIVQELKPGFNFDLGTQLQEVENNKTQMRLILLTALLFIYAVLAVQFESFLYPVIILLTVPLAALGALIPIWLIDSPLTLFHQVGLLTLIGLISKHGILIVEFGKNLLESGKTPVEAAFEAARLRIRPILMTTGAMVFGIFPLMLSNSAGSEAREAIGLVLVCGLIFGTFLTLFILPSLFAIMAQKIKS